MVADAIGDPMAPIYILRLWAHCQVRKSDRFVMPTAGLKAQCKCPADAQVFEQALIEAGYLERDGETVIVLGWAEANASLLAAWENGAKGGRPKKNPEKTHGKPMGNPSVTHGQPDANPGETDKSREEKSREEVSSLRSEKPPRKRSASEPPQLISVDDMAAEGVDPAHARDWLKARGKHPLTPTAWELLKDEADKAGITPARAVEICAAKSWRGFDATWDWPGKRSVGPPGATTPRSKQSELESRNAATAARLSERFSATS